MKVLTGIIILLFLLLIDMLILIAVYNKGFYNLAVISGMTSGFIIGIIYILIQDEL